MPGRFFTRKHVHVPFPGPHHSSISLDFARKYYSRKRGFILLIYLYILYYIISVVVFDHLRLALVGPFVLYWAAKDGWLPESSAEVHPRS